MSYESVIFDLDGTLVHTIPDYRYNMVGQTLKEFGIETSRDSIDRFWFRPDRDRVISEEFGVDPASFWPIWRKNDTIEYRTECLRLYDDVGFIRELKEKGYKIGIVTGAPRHIAYLEIGILDVDFDSIIVAHESTGVRKKPDPHGLDLCIEELGVARDKVIYVGNGDEDVMAAKSAQVYDVFLERGEHDFSGMDASLRIDSLYGLRALLGIEDNDSGMN